MATPQILPTSRSDLELILRGKHLSEKFHHLFDLHESSSSVEKKKNDKKKKKKALLKSKDVKRQKQEEKNLDSIELQPPSLELCGNPSLFSVFAKVRQTVLEQCTKEATSIYHQNSSGINEWDSEDSGDERGKDSVIKLPKIVACGLSGLFQLINETRSKYPELCLKALQSLLDLLQGQQPESMKNEPPDVVDGLFRLLMDISTQPSTDSQLSSLACSTLISLIIALGNTGKTLTAIAGILMSQGALSTQEIQVPGVLSALQRSVQAVLLGKAQLPDWFMQGIKTNAQIHNFTIQTSSKFQIDKEDCALTSDGKYLYILNKKQLITKVGTGYGGTTAGQIYAQGKTSAKSLTLWLACASGMLFCQSEENNHTNICSLDKDTFAQLHSIKISNKGSGPSALFSDGEHIGQIAAAKDQDSFVVRLYNPSVSPVTVASEVPLKLTRKCLDVFGTATYDLVPERHSINTNFDEDSVMIIGAKEFSLIRTLGGKVLYTGKAQALGIKQGAASQGKWLELPMTKSPKIVQISAGHEGQHALMVSDDGSLFFVGTPRRGEDGDTSVSKARRQPKAVKPKKLVRFESKHIVQAACNNGSSAFVTKEGEVFMFGKDSIYCDHTSGHVTDLKDITVTLVGLGKAHAVALSNKGKIFTFGINNKGQCGREFHPGGSKDTSNTVTMTEEEEETEQEELICPSGKHTWKYDQCMICTVCGECTGYGIECVHTSSAGNRSKEGNVCGCGLGDSGCSECGICRLCAGEQNKIEEADDIKPPDLKEWLNRDIPLSFLLNSKGRPSEEEFKNFWKKNMDRPIPKRLLAGVAKHSQPKAKQKESNDQDPEYNKIVSLAPAEVVIGNGDIPVVSFSCGQHHTVVLLQNGDVYAFGSNHQGQLGQGDTSSRNGPCKVQLPMAATHVAAGGHHTVILLCNGQVYTFGNYQKGALGRNNPDESGGAKNKKSLWYASPAHVPGIGARYGRRATWVGASGDQTYMRIDESLINVHILAASKVFANQTCIGLIPTGEENAGGMKCLMISKVDGSCKSLTGNTQVDLSKDAVCLDPVYDVIWSYKAESSEVRCFNVMASDARPIRATGPQQQDLFKPEIAVPTRMGCTTTRFHCALHLLSCLDTLTMAYSANLIVNEETKEKQAASKVYSKDDFSVVSRFESYGGGWGYSGYSVEAIRFMVDTDILVGGYGLFGGRGGYHGRIKLFELGADPAERDLENDLELLAETEDTAFECGPREKYAMLFDEPVPVQANIWYVAWAVINGPSSDCGSTGQPTVTTEDQVVFKFQSSKKSNNGTDVNAGQIPQILYRIPSRDSPGAVRKVNQTEPAHVLGQDFACNVTEENFEALLNLLQFSWNTFYTSVSDMEGLKGENLQAAKGDIRRLMFICQACLRLTRAYVTQIYPNGSSSCKGMSESTRLANCIGNTQDLLRRILAEEFRPSKVQVFLPETEDAKFVSLEEEILVECHETFRACFHAFYPTGSLKWYCMCDLLNQLEPDMINVTGYGRLLAAIMEALCHPTVKLTSILPINCEPQMEEILRRQSVVMDDNLNSQARLGDAHKYPVLVEHMTSRIELSGMGLGNVTFKDVLDRLLMIVLFPVRKSLSRESSPYPPVLVSNTCALLSTIISELYATATGLETDYGTSSRPLLVTPNRFTRTSQMASWSTGNGSPDAITFTVDNPGIVVAGVGVYGGGGSYEYELELMEEKVDKSSITNTQRWNSLEIVKGFFGNEDCSNDVAEIKFDRPIPIKENAKYAIRFSNNGPSTLNGDNGVSKIKCPDGTTFTFSANILCKNGTNHIRGQIPQILYYSSPQHSEAYQQSNRNIAELQARKNAIDIVSAICRGTTDVLHSASSLSSEEAQVVLGESHLLGSLLPLILAYIGPVASQDPRGAVQVLNMIQDILPMVANINSRLSTPTTGERTSESNGCTTSQHYAIVESDHPYKPAQVTNYQVIFPESVKWMVLEFDPQCATAQPEDTLQLYIPKTRAKNKAITQSDEQEDMTNSQTHQPVLNKFYGTEAWPKCAVVLPGNEIIFSLETASDYVKDEKCSFYGFKCCAVGYEWHSKPQENLVQLEQELAYLGGMVAASLIKKDIVLPPVTVEEMDEDMDFVDESSQMVFNAHASLLEKGFALSHPPTIMQALEGNLPFCWQSYERSFLMDFVSCTTGTSGGRLASWIQPDSYLDPSQCDIVYNQEDLKCSWPALITVQTKDQYGALVHVPNLKIEVKAVPMDLGVLDDDKRSRRLSRPDNSNMTFGGHSPPCLDIPYELTIKDRKDAFHAICMMKAYENYSFEELRFAAPAVPRPSENMLVRSNADGTYSASWTPGSVGGYHIHVNIDGYDAGEVCKVEVRDAPQGMSPPTKQERMQPTQTKLRKFIAQNSAGLRIRMFPSLQGEQLGIVHPKGVIEFIDEITNTDGVWLRLSRESLLKWGIQDHPEGWCLQYNKHYGKTLLVSVEETKTLADEIINDSLRSHVAAASASGPERPASDVVKPQRGPGQYQVIKCGSSGHNIRCRPSLKATPVGTLTRGDRVTALEDAINSDGLWVKIDAECAEQYCHNNPGETWSLVSGKGGITYLQKDSGTAQSRPEKDPFNFNALPSNVAKGFDFGGYGQGRPFGRSSSVPGSSFAFPSTGIGQTGPFQPQSGAFSHPWPDGASSGRPLPHTHSMPGFSDQGQRSYASQSMTSVRLDSCAQSLGNNKSPASGSPKASRREGSVLPPELQGVSVKDLVKALGESRANGNGPTPIPSPPSTPRRSGSRSSSPHLVADKIRTASPRNDSPIRSLSPKQSRSDVRAANSDSSSQASLKDEYTTPPDSPVPRKKPLKKEPEFDHSSLSPPESPLVRPKHETIANGIQGQNTSPIPSGQRKSSFGSPHTSPARRRGSGSPHLYSSPSRGSPSTVSPTPGATGGDKYFNIGTSKEESPRVSPKTGRKDRGRQLRSRKEQLGSASNSRDMTPPTRERSSSGSAILDKMKEPIKEALSPSVAECLRSVYAAFLWHEGIVHDAMACASFLKFHPDLNKIMFNYANKNKQEKTRTRHATESSKDLHRKRENTNLNENRVRFNLEPQLLRSDSEKSDHSDKSEKVEKMDLRKARSLSGVEHQRSDHSIIAVKGDNHDGKESQLPPTLHHLVYFWEDLSSSVMKILTDDIIYPSPALALKTKKAEKKDVKEKENKKKEKKKAKAVKRNNIDGLAMGADYPAAAAGLEKGETLCDLCGLTFPHPVTYHMRLSHPGCGRHAGGKGFNSHGTYCGGWAGNCGEGGFGGSSWYLICERCRDLYLKEKKQQQKEKEKAKKMKKKSSQNRHSMITQLPAHAVLKNNAMFLLDLASASGITIPTQHKKIRKTDLFLPSVTEEYGTGLNPFPSVPFQYLIALSAQNSDSAFADDFFIDVDERVLVRSGSMSMHQRQNFTRPRLPTEPRHSPLARSGSLGQDTRPGGLTHISPTSPRERTLDSSSSEEAKQMPKSAGTSPESELEMHKKTAFQRSISEIVTDVNEGFGSNEKVRHYDGRRRNNSGGGVLDSGSSLLKNPSAAMNKLISSVEKTDFGLAAVDGTIQRPVMAFIIQRHDLESLQLAMRQSLRKSACRVYAMQALNWLLRTVTKTMCIHDLLWFLVSSLLPPAVEEEDVEEEEDDKDKKAPKKVQAKKDPAEETPLCEHPISDITIGGKAVDPLPEVFHILLQSIADVMMHLPWGSAVQLMAVRCFCVKFLQSDHQFLHESHVFSNISCILSKSDEEKELRGGAEPPQVKDLASALTNHTAAYKVSQLKDLTAAADIQASSRQAMIASLTDNSTETFWESGDEDRNKVKTLTITCQNRAQPKYVFVHIDNSRDLGSKVSSVAFSAGVNQEEMKKIQQIMIDNRHVGWVNCQIVNTKYTCIQLELKGPDHSLRVRQLKVLGDSDGENIPLPAKKSAQDMQKDNCESETLKVFRLLTSQVFGKLIVDKLNDEAPKGLINEDSLDGDHDLKEHMVGILFSRSGKLSQLQKQVCSHIVQGIRKETTKVKDEWEASFVVKQKHMDPSDQDTYCFELLSMVLALSGSDIGRNYLAQQYPLLQDLFSLLHTGTPRVQRQVISVLRRVLPDVKPQTLATILSVPALPPTEYSIVSLATKEDGDENFDPNRPCILDVLLSCISKALTVQTRVKVAGPQKGTNSLTLSQCLGDFKSTTDSRWWIKGSMTSVMANQIISLLQDMALGKLSDTWAQVTKAAVAEAILALTKLDESHRVPEVCVKTPTLWLALASLCVLDKDHVERLTSGQWVSSPNGQHGQPRPTCDNHDDGETQAIILCNDCGNLCAECDRFLHLPRKKRTHPRQVFKEEEEAIKVDLHEGCGRTKLFWVMALADARTLKAMVEFREGKTMTAGASGIGVCRFCGASSKTGLLAIGNVCSDPDCQDHAKNACSKVLSCGHQCGGIQHEEECLPCLHGCNSSGNLKQDADDMCMICFTEALSAAPAIQLKCLHVFHLHCSKNILEKRWVGPRITFGFSLCPICKSQIDHPVLKDLLKPIKDLFEDVKRKALMRLEYEGLHKTEAITTPGARFYQDPAGFAMDRYAYYVCFKCSKAYYGGEARCEEQAGGGEDYNPQELVCGACSDVSRAQMCPKHGTDFLEYKCRYCCSVAVFFCFGTTHFCNACHDDFQRVTNISRSELPSCPAGPKGKQLEGDECPLHVKHPPTGEEFALGCGVCRNAHTF